MKHRRVCDGLGFGSIANGVRRLSEPANVTRAVVVRVVVLVMLILMACGDLGKTSGKDTPASSPVARSPSVVAVVSLETGTSSTPTPVLSEGSAGLTPMGTPFYEPTDERVPTVVLGPVAHPSSKPPTGFGINVEPVAEGFVRPVFVGHAGDASGRLFIAEKRGVIRVVRLGRLLEEPFLDIRDRVGSSGNEQGLLGIAFHPGYALNGRLFVDYTDLSGDTVISEFLVDSSGRTVDVDSEQIVLRIKQPFKNHNGGMLAFGPNDGYLYVAVGDGGSGGDPQANGQDPGNLLGSILRLNVNEEGGYVIPADNPFVNARDKRSEVFVYGLRNPWRFSFDQVTGDLWIGDVGQNDLEEIDLALAPLRGGLNFGWNKLEGSQCFPPGLGVFTGCVPTDFEPPVAEYGRDYGCSVTGGYVYRGQRFAELVGMYVFGDYCSGRIWTLELGDSEGWQMVQRGKVAGRIASFGEGEDGEIYVVEERRGQLLRLLVTNSPPQG